MVVGCLTTLNLIHVMHWASMHHHASVVHPGGWASLPGWHNTPTLYAKTIVATANCVILNIDDPVILIQPDEGTSKSTTIQLDQTWFLGPTTTQHNTWNKCIRIRRKTSSDALLTYSSIGLGSSNTSSSKCCCAPVWGS